MSSVSEATRAGFADLSKGARIEPDAHGVFSRALELDVADARQARQYVLDVQRRVIRQVERVAHSSGE